MRLRSTGALELFWGMTYDDDFITVDVVLGEFSAREFLVSATEMLGGVFGEHKIKNHDGWLTSGLREALTFLVSALPYITPPVRVPVLAYSDASWSEFGLEDDAEPPRLGWVILWPAGLYYDTHATSGTEVAPVETTNHVAEALPQLNALHHCVDTIAPLGWRTRRCYGSLTTWVR